MRNPIRTTEWSSTMRTRILVCSVTWAPGAEASGGGWKDRWESVESSKGAPSWISPGEGHGSRDDGGDQVARAECLADEPVGGSDELGLLGWVRPAHHEDADAGRQRPEPMDERETRVRFRKTRIDDDDVGFGGQYEVDRRTGLSGTADDAQQVTDTQQPGQALPNPLIGIDKDDAERPGSPGVGLHIADGASRTVRAKRTIAHGRPAERRGGSTSSVADRHRIGRVRRVPARRDRGLRHDDLDGRSLAGHARYRESGADLVGTGPHAGQPEVSVGDARWIEPLAVVHDPQADPAGDPADLEPDLAGAGVLDHVVESFLRDPVEDLLDRQRQPLVERALDHDRQAEPTLERGRVGPQRPAQAILLQVAGPELEDQCPHLREGLALE